MKRFVTALGCGAILGLLVAPRPGRETRSRLRGAIRELLGGRRDPEDRWVISEQQVREKMMDKTLADSFPASDPPSSIPDPSEDSIVA